MSLSTLLRSTTILCTALALCAAPAHLIAQEEVPEDPVEEPAKAEEEEAADDAEEDSDEEKVFFAIRGADIYIGDGTVLRRGTVLVENGKIKAVGHDVEIPEEAKVVDATGKVVSPGFIAVRGSGFGAPSSFGLEEIKDSLNPHHASIKLGLACGITSFGMLANGGRDKPAGKSAVLKLAPGDLDGMLCAENTIVSMRMPLNASQWRSFRETVEKARKFIDERDNPKKDDEKDGKAESKPTTTPQRGRRGRPSRAASSSAKPAAPKPPRGTEIFVEILEGKKTLWIDLGNQSRGWFGGPSESDNEKIRQAMEVSELLGKGVVLDQPIAAWVNPEQIAATGSMVILNPRNRVPAEEGKPDTTGSNLAAGAILAEVGVPVIATAPSASLSLGGTYGQDLSTPTVDAAYLVRGGLENRKALRTITLDSARALGVGDRLGSVEVGKEADLLILDGDPLHYRTLVDTAIVNGKVVYERENEPFFSHIQR